MPILNIRRSDDRLGFIMGISTPTRRYILSEMGPRAVLYIEMQPRPGGEPTNVKCIYIYSKCNNIQM